MCDPDRILIAADGLRRVVASGEAPVERAVEAIGAHTEVPVLLAA